MAKTYTGSRCPFNGISIRSDRINMPKEFCERFVGQNKFASLKWDDQERILSITFWLTDSEIGHRYELTDVKDQSVMRIMCARFIKLLRRFPIGRYEATDIEMTRQGKTVIKFKL